MTKAQAHSRASAYFLTEEFPSDIFDFNEQEIFKFIQENAWEPLEGWEPLDVWELIESLASEFHAYTN